VIAFIKIVFSSEGVLRRFIVPPVVASIGVTAAQTSSLIKAASSA